MQAFDKSKSLTRGLFLIAMAAVIFGLAVIGYITLDPFGNNPIHEDIAGTGSMYPTFPKGTGETSKANAEQTVATVAFNRYPGGVKFFEKRYFTHTFERGDIISFQNNATDKITKDYYGEKTGFIKRIVALPRDTLELRNGIVYLNDKPLKEPYIARPRSTFAEAFLIECKKITIPANKLFVMGDNRKGSIDSREIGFVDFKDVTIVLPFSAQKNTWDEYWRDTTKDFDNVSGDAINKKEYLDLLNEKRREAGVPLLKYRKELEQTAQKRGEIMLQFNDFSFEASRSGYTMERAMGDIGYFNNFIGESISQGYFTESQKFLLDKDYEEVGIAEVKSKINGCSKQIIVQHYAGDVPPNYKIKH